MKIIKLLIIFNLILNYTPCYSQDIKMDKAVEELIAVGKDSIVELALKSLNSETVNYTVSRENFKKIKTFTNGKNIMVSFSNPIKYLPQNTVFYCDVFVRFLGSFNNRVLVSNPVDFLSTLPDYYDYEIPIYEETKEMRRNMQFVFEAIDKSNEIGSIGDRSNFEDDMTIREYKNHYDIILCSEHTKSWYKIEKISGKIYDGGHKHKQIAPNPFEIEYKEINWD